ncbi:MAG: hypothetical protein DCC71_06260 [Proteobacteria bacterium]|nr:MAG: hypothetical protein DCC71_06260 [Pseudomonadota bacterium]
MISRWTTAFAVIATLAFSPSLATASDANVERQLDEMQKRMQQMEDKLQATNDQLESANQRVEEQSQLIEQSGLAETRGSSNGLPGFLGEITVGGWVAASYLYNINDPNDDFNDGVQGLNSGLNGAFYPLHPDHNSFSLDQVWWEIERPISEEHRGGFRLDTTYGKTGALLSGPNNRGDRDDSSIYVSQAYVQYLAPIGDGLTFKAGKFNTLIGVEVAQTVYNWNITRGSLWTLLQPVDHIGVLASYAFGDSGFDIALGGVNGFRPDDPDRNDAKSFLGRVGWTGDTASFALSNIYGAEGTGDDGDETGVLDAIVKFNPTDRLAFWLNGDYAYNDSFGKNAWGVAAAGRFGITDRTGIALRGEYVSLDENPFGLDGIDGVDGFEFLAPGETDTWGITATIDHLLTDNLMVRAEARYDWVTKDDVDNEEFWEDSAELDDDQIVVGAEIIYNFNKFGGE